jgi:hypothetical protein
MCARNSVVRGIIAKRALRSGRLIVHTRPARLAEAEPAGRGVDTRRVWLRPMRHAQIGSEHERQVPTPI